jgi:hypothetical protein
MKHACEKHEKGCWGNPENHAVCFSCKHYEPPYVGSESDGYQSISGFYSHRCSLKNKYMLSGKQIAKGHFVQEYCEKDSEWKHVQEKLPTKCEEHKYEELF